eukprot:gene13866-9913_t
MELARQERELAKPINWGERIYASMKRSESAPLKTQEFRPYQLSKTLTLDSAVRKLLEDHPTIHGPLTISPDSLDELSEEEQCAFFACYTQLQSIVLHRWMNISKNVLRCISITFGEGLLEADFSHSAMTSAHLEALLVRAEKIHTLRLNRCPLINTQACNVITALANRSLTALSLHAVPNLSTEGLMWIGGAAGVAGRSLRKLRILDVGECVDIEDRGVIAVARGCPKLRMLNLEELHNLTDASLAALTEGCADMQVINLTGCQKLTNKSIVAIGKRWSKLVSINLSRCRSITDKGLKNIAFGCKALQAINLAGLLKISEESMFCLADQCKGLLTMNLTGCERITINGLDHLVQGLSFVEKAVSFFGFKPMDQYIAMRLDSQLRMIEQRDIYIVEQERQRQEEAAEEVRRVEDQRLFHAAKTIQGYLYRYKMRMRFYRMWVDRTERAAASFVQRLYRGYLGRLQATRRRRERDAFLQLSPYAVLLQKTVRAFLCRIRHGLISRKIREMYMLRQREAIQAMMVPIQCQVRKYLARKRVHAIRQLHIRRQLNMQHAITLLQVLARRFLAKMRVTRIRINKKNYETARFNAGTKIALFLAEGMRRYKARLTGEELKRFFRHKWAASEVMQRVYRGYRARERIRQVKIRQATQYYAAREIQRIYRGTRVLNWRDMRLNVIAAYVLDRHYVERRERVQASRLRYKAFMEENLKDSASEPDTESDPEEYPYLEQFDDKRKRKFWQNYITNDITFDEPPRPLALEKNMVGQRCRVYWIVQSNWYEGTITRYHKRKQRHRVEYDDGDHEWLNLAIEADRVQIQLADGSYAMYNMYAMEAKADEVRKQTEKLERDEYKAQAFRDAKQWRAFTDDHNGQIMFFSDLTGELRSAASGAMDWVVQDDGYGFPCFYNEGTRQIVYEDPRFTYDVADDLVQQRKYVMQEVRYGVYVCKDLWEQYTRAVTLQDPRQLDKIMFKIRNHPKVTQLSAFIIRARSLHEVTSIVDKPLYTTIYEELDYAQWLVNQLSDVTNAALVKLRQREDKKRELVGKLTETSGQEYFCRHCQRKTQRHLDFCPNCGKRQLFL